MLMSVSGSYINYKILTNLTLTSMDKFIKMSLVQFLQILNISINVTLYVELLIISPNQIFRDIMVLPQLLCPQLPPQIFRVNMKTSYVLNVGISFLAQAQISQRGRTDSILVKFGDIPQPLRPVAQAQFKEATFRCNMFSSVLIT